MASILIVDDDSRTRQLFHALLTPFGHEVHEASDGRAGLEVAQEARPNLILTDILMPTMNGYEFVCLLRQTPGFEDTPVIFQSASFLDHQSRALGAQCGVRDFLSKPCEPEAVLETVNRLLRLPVALPSSPQPAVSANDPIPALIDAFYEKGQELDTVTLRLAAILDLGLQISQITLPRELMEKTTAASRRIIGAAYAVAAAFEGNGSGSTLLAASGFDAATAAQLNQAAMGNTFQKVANGKAFRLFNRLEQPPGLELPASHPPVSGFLGVPLLTSTHNYGMIYVANKLGEEAFTPDDERILTTIAAKLAIAYENILRYRSIQEQTKKLEHEIEQRKQAEERFRLLIETAPTGILICDDQGCITEGNAQLQRMFGYAREELVGQTIELLVPEQHRGMHVGHRTGYLGQPQSRPMGLGMELRGRRKDGTTFPVEISLGPLTTNEGMLISSTVVDISERKRLEQQVQVSQRLESVGQLAAGIAHDFNNILAAITGNAKLARTDFPADSPTQQNLAEIEKASRRATQLVRQILTFSRQETPKRQLVKLAPVVEEAVKLLRAALRAGIDIRTYFDDKLPEVSADSTQIHQIVMNLGTNAADAMAEHGGVLDIRLDAVSVNADLAHTSPELREGQYVRLSMRDSGCGIDMATMGRMFEPFYTTKPKGEGTGLGLSVVHGIVKSHGGAITVDTELGNGTVFQLYFPAAQGMIEEARPFQAQEEARGHGEHILFVDDEESLVLLMTRMLKRLGYRVTGFTDPERAIETLQKQPNEFDAVVSDLSMPGMSGTEMARAMLQIRPGMPILIASGYIRPKDQEEARSLGLHDLILKPDTVEQLGEILHKLFEKTKDTATDRRKAARSHN